MMDLSESTIWDFQDQTGWLMQTAADTKTISLTVTKTQYTFWWGTRSHMMALFHHTYLITAHLYYDEL